jgi:2-polyprenyl-3-methyl-5-hydroxy-6-metoxy-1,4-benzoquinol methylase
MPVPARINRIVIVRYFNYPEMFDKRSYEAELVDDMSLEGEVMAQTLRELRFINRWLGGNSVTTRGLDQLYQTYINQKLPPGILTIADIGCGGGDMLMLIAEWARRRNLPVRLIGIDANEYTIRYARQNTRHYPEISYQVMDVFSDAFEQLSVDILTCTLFCHHFTDAQLVELFRRARAQTRIGLVINDLHRHWLAYHSIKWLTRWFSRSALVKNDAKLSVLRAFRRNELLTMLERAGFRNASIRWKWAFRWQVVGVAF